MVHQGCPSIVPAAEAWPWTGAITSVTALQCPSHTSFQAFFASNPVLAMCVPVDAGNSMSTFQLLDEINKLIPTDASRQ